MPQTAKRDVPVNLRQSGEANVGMLVGTRIRKSAFWHRSVEHGVRDVTVYNKMYHPRLYFSQEAGGLLGEHRYLTEHVTLWNVAVERQVQIKGPDALSFVDRLVTRRMTGDKELKVNKARYVVLCDQHGGIVNDPILLRVAEDEFWISISDTDVLLWARGLNYGLGYDVEIRELDVAPVQIQGPKSEAMMRSLVPEIDDLKFHNLMHTRIAGCDVVVSKTGFSSQVGFEVYLHHANRDADKLWDALLEAGEPHMLEVIAPGHISRIEAGILSYGQDMDIETNPFEVGLDWQVHLDKDDFIGKEALQRIKEQGVGRKLVGLTFNGHPVTWYNADFWPVFDGMEGEEIGYVTSAFYSPGLETNIARAMVPIAHSEVGSELAVDRPAIPGREPAFVVDVPFTKSPRRARVS